MIYLFVSLRDWFFCFLSVPWVVIKTNKFTKLPEKGFFFYLNIFKQKQNTKFNFSSVTLNLMRI